MGNGRGKGKERRVKGKERRHVGRKEGEWMGIGATAAMVDRRQ